MESSHAHLSPATRWLVDYLLGADGYRAYKTEIMAAAVEAGYSPAQLRRARKEAGVISLLVKEPHPRSVWSLLASALDIFQVNSKPVVLTTVAEPQRSHDDFRIALELELIAHGYAPGRTSGEYVYPPNAQPGTRRVFAGGFSICTKAAVYVDLVDAHGHRSCASSDALDAYLEEVLLLTRPGQVSGSAGRSAWSVFGMRPEDLLTHIPAILRLGKLEVHRSLTEGATQ